jgi:membrane protein
VFTKKNPYLSLLTFTAREFYYKNCFQKASTLAYSSLMALAPLVALFLTIFDTRPLRRIVNEARKFLLENLAPQSIEPVDTFID